MRNETIRLNITCAISTIFCILISLGDPIFMQICLLVLNISVYLAFRKGKSKADRYITGMKYILFSEAILFCIFILSIKFHITPIEKFFDISIIDYLI